MCPLSPRSARRQFATIELLVQNSPFFMVDSDNDPSSRHFLGQKGCPETGEVFSSRSMWPRSHSIKLTSQIPSSTSMTLCLRCTHGELYTFFTNLSGLSQASFAMLSVVGGESVR